jgi:hypothetical protein
MTVSAADLLALRRLEETLPSYGAADLSVLETVDEGLAYVVADARATGDDEADAVEMTVRHAGMTAPEVRQVAATLKALGYTTAAERLKQVAGRRRRDLNPL